jgi:hypothetical protein
MDEEELFKNLELAKKIVLLEDKELLQELAKNSPQDAKDVENDFGLLKNVDVAMTADNIPQELPMPAKQDKNEDLLLAGKCSRCNKERKIYSVGQCKSCYNYLHLNKEKHKLDIAKWKEKNPNYFRDYYRNVKSKTDWVKKEKDLNT